MTDTTTPDTTAAAPAAAAIDTTASPEAVDATDGTAEAAQDATDGPETSDGTDTADTDDDGAQAKSAANKEAAKWRTKFRAAERERDDLAARLTTLQRGEAERVAGTHLTDGADLWRDGAELDAVLDEAGNVDPAKVAEVAAAVAAHHPHYAKRPPSVNLKRGGLASGATGLDSPRRASWSEVIRG
jgi:hypothetical protein